MVQQVEGRKVYEWGLRKVEVRPVEHDPWVRWAVFYQRLPQEDFFEVGRFADEGLATALVEWLYDNFI